MYFGRGGFDAIKSAVTQARAQAANKPKSKPKKASKGANVFGIAKAVTDLKIGGQGAKAGSELFGVAAKATKDSKQHTLNKKTKKPTAKKVAKKTAGVNPGSAAINI